MSSLDFGPQLPGLHRRAESISLIFCAAGAIMRGACVIKPGVGAPSHTWPVPWRDAFHHG